MAHSIRAFIVLLLVTCVGFSQFKQDEIGFPGSIGHAGLPASTAFHPRAYSPSLMLTDDSGVYTDAAAEFVAADKSWLQVASDSTLQMGSKDFSIALWIKPSSEHYGIVLGKWTVGNREYSLYYNYGTISFATYSTSQTTCSVSGLSANQWWFVVATYTLSDNKLRVSVNNGSQTEVVMTGTITSGSAALTIGYDVPDNTFFNGSMDNLAIWNRILTPAERTTLYNSGAGINYSDLTTAMKVNLVSWWGFNESSGTRYDSHGSNNLTETFANIIDASTLNGGFETAGGGGADVFANWVEVVSGASLISAETSIVYAGTYACKITVDASNSFAGINQSVLTVGKRYSATAVVRATGGSWTWNWGGSDVPFSTTTSYAQVSTGLFTPTTTQFYMKRGGSANESLYIDNVTLVAAEIKSTSGVARGLATSGETVSLWTDQSTAARNWTQTTFSKRATLNTTNGVTPDAVDDVHSYTALALTGDFTIAFRGKVTSGTFFGHSSGTGRMYQNSSTQTIFVNDAGSSATLTHTALDASKHTIQYTRSGSTITRYLDGVSDGTTTLSGTITVNQGWLHGASTGAFSGSSKGIIIYPNATPNAVTQHNYFITRGL